MRIKQLKLNGFKSFADKTVIEFDDNFIGVVGPNGSGKSNVIDAIRWVFGEQSSKSLRGQSSTDIIFGGTEKRKKQNIAEVTIVLDNSDGHLDVEWSEVSFTRRLYRSGNSEYLINGAISRNRDIQELIMDKGIGKNAFSIISQGKIEGIITKAPEKRRVIVEEVAGILKYKKRKESALSKLAKTDDNLEQVNLILNEIEERRGPLERQAKIAEKFQVYKSELEQHEIDLLATRLVKNEEEHSGLEQLTETNKLALIANETKVTSLEIEYDNLKSKARELGVNLNSLNQKLIDKNNLLAKTQANIRIINERNALLQGSDEKILELENKKLSLQSELAIVKREYNDAKSHVQELQKRDIELKNSMGQVRSQMNEVNLEINDIKQDLNKVSIPFATRKILAANIKGVEVTVNDSFHVDLKHTEAISTIIGGRSNDIITSDKVAASKAINFLKKNKYGRQTFLPRDGMRINKVNGNDIANLKKVKGYIGIAVDLIRYDQVNDNVFKNLLGNVIICETLQVANYIAAEVTNRYRIVTLEGDVVQVSGAMSGGRSNRKNKLVLESNLVKAKNKKQQLMYQVDSKSQRVEKNTEKLIEAKTSLKMEQALIERHEQELNVVLGQLRELDVVEEQVVDDDINQIQRVETEITDINADRTKIEIEKTNLEETMDNLEYEIKNLSDEIKVQTKTQNEYEIRLERIRSIIKTDIATLREDYSMSFAMVRDNANVNVDIESFEVHVKSLKSRIRNLGPINILAIDEYHELTDRFEFIDEQRRDLLVAKDKLEAIINKLDQFFIQSFDSTYVKLRREFRHVYKELFGGGHADLILTNDEDMLNTGVEIVAQPPGKKLQTISLLSGGEKALTAIALLFAILRIKSLPFAILDEVEAALDEANVKRYAKYIKIFSERTQFIVITHRQGTMEVVDSLYGVTMQEKGVSSLVKVTLTEGENYV